MGDAGSSLGGLPSPRPGPLQRRDHGKAGFIFQNEGRAQLATLFLSWAALPPSSVPPPHRRAVEAPAGVVGCSIPSAASRAKRRSVCNGLQTTPRSRVRSGPASSNLRHIRRRRPLDPKPFPAVSPVSTIISSACPAVAPPSSWGVSLHTSTVERPARLRSIVPQLLGSSYPVRGELARVAGSRPVVHLFLFVSCPYYDTIYDYCYSKINSSMILGAIFHYT